MNVEEFQDIKNKIETAKEKKARAEGAKAKIEDQWRQDFGVSTIEEANAKLKEIKMAVQNGNDKLEKMYERLEKLTDWEDA